MSEESIAIIGMSGRFPGAGDVDTLWRNLAAGRESIDVFTVEELAAAGIDEALLRNPRYVRAQGRLAGCELFDAAFFGYGPREAELMAPQQRLFLECAWNAMEDAGHAPGRGGDRGRGGVGVFAGADLGSYLIEHVYPNRQLLASVGRQQARIAGGHDFLATRVAFDLDLRGPALTVQTACSTSLVAVSLACQHLLSGDCDTALAGGVSLRLPQTAGYIFQEDGILSPDGHCRAFSADARGTVPGSGVAAVVLRRLEDALADGDPVRAVIRGWATNNDGGGKGSFTAPASDGQAEVIREALAFAGLGPEDISYVEAHGTGTHLGDRIEVAALKQAFGRGAGRGRCALGSLKSNIGHLDAAAGVSGLIKTTLALEHRLIPASLHCREPNPELGLKDSPFYVPSRATPWPADSRPRRAGVSSFGIGGTNAHLVVEQAPDRAPSATDGPTLFLLSARSAEALERRAAGLVVHGTAHPELDGGDVAYTLHVGRAALEHRRAVVADNLAEVCQALADGDPERVAGGVVASDRPSPAFLFPGQGSQYVEMARGIYATEPVFRRHLDRCADGLRGLLDTDLTRLLFPSSVERRAAGEALGQTRLAQPALFAVETALARLWGDWGVEPEAMLGHSVGEFSAAYLAGVFDLRSALTLVVRRGELMQRMPPGAMLTVPLSEDALSAEMPPELELAAVNAPEVSTVTGPPAAINDFEQRLTARQLPCRRLHVAHAFHSAAVEPFLEDWRMTLEGLELSAPRVPFLSNVSGGWITGEEATDPEYWVRHLREGVRFSPALIELLAEPSRVLLEVGPGQTLTSLARQHPEARGRRVVASMRHPQDSASDREVLLRAAGQLWLDGTPFDGARLHGQRLRVRLPGYPFEGQRYWLEAPGAPAAPNASSADTSPAAGEMPAAAQVPAATLTAYPRRLVDVPYRAPEEPLQQSVVEIWQEILGIDQIGVDDDFFALGGSSLSGLQILSRLRAELDAELPLARFFEAHTPAQMASVIAAEREAAPLYEESLADILAEVEALDDEQVEAELGGEISQSPEAEPVQESEVVRGRSEQYSETSRVPSPERSWHSDDSAAMSFSVMFFSADGSSTAPGKYRMLLECARFADREGYSAVWTPERHFQDFGGIYPNPSVLGAALAATTERLQIRAGSVVVPLHHPVRLAEEWAVVDNLSDGRAAISAASGWHAHDFILAPGHYADRSEVMFQNLQVLRRLWRGEAVPFPGPDGNEVEVRVRPQPLQEDLPIWVTCVGNLKTWERAGEIGAHVLTSLGSKPLDELSRKIARYREALQRAGHDPAAGTVSLMLHTFLGEDSGETRNRVRGPMGDYLRTHVQQRADVVQLPGITDAEQEELLASAMEHYIDNASLIGTPEDCAARIERFRDAGVDEIACLVDFGLELEEVLASLELLNTVRRRPVSVSAGSAVNSTLA